MFENPGYHGRQGVVTSIVDSGALTIDTNIYASGDCLTAGYITFAGMAQSEGWGGNIVGGMIIEDAGSGNTAQLPAGTLLLFNRPPAIQTINDAVALAEGDILNYVGQITFTAGSSLNTRYGKSDISFDSYYETFVGSETLSGDTALYGIFVISTTSTFASGAILRIKLKVILD